MAMRGDAVQAAQETAKLTISTVVEGVAEGIIEIGAATPIVAPLCKALLKAKAIVDGASRNKEELAGLHERCDLITVQVIDDKTKASNSSTIDVSPLKQRIDQLKDVAERYHDRGRWARLAQFSQRRQRHPQASRPHRCCCSNDGAGGRGGTFGETASEFDHR